MYARSSTIHADLAQIGTGIAYVRDTVMPALSHLDGYVGLSLMVDRDSGRCIATSAWQSESAMRASAARVGPIRDQAADAFGGTAEVEEWEVAVMHRAHHSRLGTCMRATWSTTDTPRIDEAVDAFKFGTLAKIEDLAGFCSASLFVDRSRARSVVTVAYDDESALAATRDRGAAVREEAARESGASILDVAEFDLALAHLHVPELV